MPAIMSVKELIAKLELVNRIVKNFGLGSMHSKGIVPMWALGLAAFDEKKAMAVAKYLAQAGATPPTCSEFKGADYSNFQLTQKSIAASLGHYAGLKSISLPQDPTLFDRLIAELSKK